MAITKTLPQDAPADRDARAAADAPQEEARGQRLLSLDVFRGLTVLGMILVDKPGSWDNLYWPLEHAHWLGWTPTDLVFPFFLFIVGASLAFSLRNRRADARSAGGTHWRIVRRTLMLVALGLMLNQSTRVAEYLAGHADTLGWDTWRFPGVLQRIAVVYLAASLLAMHASLRAQILFAVGVLAGYAALLSWLPNPSGLEANLSPEGNVVRLVDHAIIGVDHLYTRAAVEKTDPEGVLSTLPAIVTALLGCWAGRYLAARRPDAWDAARLAGAGAACVAAGLLWGPWLPVSKKLWTSSFVLLTGGAALIALGACVLAYEAWGWRWGAKALRAVGVNAIFIYVASWLLEVLLDTITIGGVTCKEWIYGALFTSWIHTPQLASFAYAIATVVLWWAVALLARLKWRFVV